MELNLMAVVRSLLLFVLAGLCEIGGGYLVWLTIRGGRSIGFAASGAVLLILYGFVATLQTQSFGRVFAAYGGVFIVMSILWGWQVDKVQPDRFDVLGGIIALAGVAVIMYWPRS
jgi:small multidrug resistance family-3 protein